MSKAKLITILTAHPELWSRIYNKPYNL